MSVVHGLSASGTVLPIRVTATGAMDIYDDVAEKCVISAAAAVMVNGDDIFTITGGPIQIVSLASVCVTANNGTASTLQYRADGTDGAATTISGASASLASVAAGTIVAAVPGTLATAPVVYANGVGIAGTVGIIVPAGIIELVIGVGSTTGTWMQFLRYIPLTPNSIVN